MSGNDEERRQRLAEALRENLRRRKAQRREAPTPPPDSQAGTGAPKASGRPEQE